MSTTEWAATTSEHLVAWVRDQVTASGLKGAVFGISGGIDSAVVAALCQRALPDRCLGIHLPCHSAPVDWEDAQLTARALGVPLRRVDLDQVYDTFLTVLPVGEFDPTTSAMAQANLKPRLRMATLYYFANRLHYLVAGTGNRSELEVGYFTKYGDGGVDILPLANLVKTEVRALARYLGVPAPIIAKPPSAGLWAGQTDETEMGLAYADLDRYLLGGTVAPPLQARIQAMHDASAHKRRPQPTPPQWGSLPLEEVGS